MCHLLLFVLLSICSWLVLVDGEPPTFQGSCGKEFKQLQGLVFKDKSPDGRHMLFHAYRGDHSWRVILDTTTSDMFSEYNLKFTPDYQTWDYYTAVHDAGTKNPRDLLMYFQYPPGNDSSIDRRCQFY